MGDHSFVDIAAAAANLAERLRVVARLDATGPARPADPLPRFDAWKIDRISRRLAVKTDGRTPRPAAPAGHGRDGLMRALTAFRNHELGLGEADDGTKAVFAEVQRSWLPTYQAAVGRFDRSADDAPDARWRRPETYYGRLAIACEPFLRELGRRMDTARARRPGRFGRRMTEDLQWHLFERFELSLAWAVEADAKVYRAEAGIDREQATREDFRAYLDATFADAAAHHGFHLRFPVLGRWLAHVTALLADFGCELIERLDADAAAIGREIFGEGISSFRSLRPGLSDYHAGARSVAVVEARLADGTTGSFVYKPRSLTAEAAMQELLGRLRDDGVLGFAPHVVLRRTGYGYEELIPRGRNQVTTRGEAERIYRELGGHLGIFYVLGGDDLHFENVLVADGHAHVCDCETALSVIPRGQAQPPGTLLDSVFRTGLLEWPRGAGSGAAIRASGYSGGEAYEVPMPVPCVKGRRDSFRMSVTHVTGVRVEPETYNRVFLGGTLVRPEDFTEAIMEGFGRIYEWFAGRPDAAVRAVTEIFGGASVRYVNWGTQAYVDLLQYARHPKCLVDPLEVDLVIGTVRTFPQVWDQDGRLAEREVESMWRLDVPIFTADARGGPLVHDHTTALATGLDISPLDHAVQRIRLLSADNRDQQCRYIAAGLSTSEVATPAFTSACVEQASRIGERLCAMLREPSEAAPWTSYKSGPDGPVRVGVGGDLYDGATGIALFLAYLDHIAPRPEFRQAAERALSHAIAAADRREIGAFKGVGGLIYLLTHLHRLWGDRELLKLAVRLGENLRIEDDAALDIFSGVAGLVPVLLGLASEADGRGIEQARSCAEVLLRHAVGDADTLSWPPPDPRVASADLTGFAHGAAGIGWALIRLGRLTDRPEYVTAGLRAFAYEARHFDEATRDWYDLRTRPGGFRQNGRYYANAWCNGAAGIGLSRVASWAILGGEDESLLRETRYAVSATLRNFPRLRNDTLCHGRSGNAELFLRFATLQDEPVFRLEANVQAHEQWRHFGETENGVIGQAEGVLPGLMAGMSGFGMHVLRLAHPDRIPSPLLLDPVPGT
ncbi:type 2 lanthipeptide synthetase LanM family protein [Actinoallomurus rhizosphaericola]|uniref:type 2 lanthipeptide synthetase LanM family protein n=1 Tax=Actinoallomurus rhizosphaericola TaxID=2952536 RepID=UPI002093CDE2|nr:type 2 lanthipeptide synthetase LanM family protein [Actinoallomurus rhizosphaericola]MCO5999703.1 type 2 lanthipeptide synthetase LanM family protein [Actinoallomurus rhizosphaericola]